MDAGKRTLLVAVLTVIIFCLSGIAAAEVKAIPLDMLEHGTPPSKEGWIRPGKEYQDESIHVVLYAKKRFDTTIRWVVVEIKDPTQLRTALSYDCFEIQKDVAAGELAKYLNPVVACNDDMVKMNVYRGYVMRQGVLYNNNLDEWAEDLKQDVLIIDDHGDFSVVPKAYTVDVEARIAELESQGRKAVNTFTFGPTLVIDGELQPIVREESEHAVNLAAARTAICQLDTLTYAIFAVDGVTGVGTNCSELGRFILEIFPDCKVAYNLDGGGSSKLFMGTRLVNNAPGRRGIQGMIYFASAVSEN